jgi:hypothetical protein
MSRDLSRQSKEQYRDRPGIAKDPCNEARRTEERERRKKGAGVAGSKDGLLTRRPKNEWNRELIKGERFAKTIKA